MASPSSSTSTTLVATRSCPGSAVTASVAGSSGAAGTIETTIAFRNASPDPCVLGGYPGAQLIDARGAQLPTTVVRGGNYPFTSFAPSTVTLAPGGVAYFNVASSDVPVGGETSCPNATELLVTPPNAYAGVTVAATIVACGHGTLTVSPAFPPGASPPRTPAP